MFAAALILICPLVLLHQGSALLLDEKCNYYNTSKATHKPWMAQITTSTKQCTGTLINNQHVLTAATCVESQLNIRVRLGDFTNPKLGLRIFEDFDVKTPIVHNLFNPISRLNDIALLRLKSKVVYNAHIQPICFSLSDETEVRTVNYSAFLFGDQGPRKVPIRRQHQNHCDDAFWFAPRNTQICGTSKDRISSCVETGSPLVKKITGYGFSHHRIVGINSYGRSETCVYTNVTSYADWILENILDVEIINLEI